MQTWARRGLRTALVTGGLLLLGTGTAAAATTENVHPDQPTATGVPATISGGNVHSTGEWGARSGDLAEPAADVTRTAGHGPLGAGATMFRVPVDVLGRAVDNGYQRVVVDEGDTAPRLELPFGQHEQFGPADSVDDLLRADQVPALGGLFRPRRPVSTMDMTQVFPVLPDGVADLSTLDMTQQLPAVRDVPTPRNTPFDPAPAYEPMSGELPVSGWLPPRVPVSGPSAPSLAGLPDLPPVPTLPAMPPLPGRPATQDLFAPRVPVDSPQPPKVNLPSLPQVQSPRVSGPVADGVLGGARPSAQDLPARAPRFSAPELTAPITRPGAQDVPAGAAQQLMAQLRGLISELENSGPSDGVHPLERRMPDRMEPPMR